MNKSTFYQAITVPTLLFLPIAYNEVCKSALKTDKPLELLSNNSCQENQYCKGETLIAHKKNNTNLTELLL